MKKLHVQASKFMIPIPKARNQLSQEYSFIYNQKNYNDAQTAAFCEQINLSINGKFISKPQLKKVMARQSTQQL